MNLLRTVSMTALFGLALTVCLAPAAFAAGTNAGATISNQASLTYDVGGVGQSVSSDDPTQPGTSDPTDFVVDNRVDLTMTGGNNLSASGAGNRLVFTVQNTGNEDQGYALELFTGAGTDDDFNMNSLAVWVDADKSGTVNAGDVDITALMGSGTRVADVAANAGAASTIQILVVGDVPAATPNGDTAAYTLKATTLNAGTNVPTTATAGANTTGVDVVLADADAGAGVNAAADGQYNGQFLATGTFTVNTAQLSISKAAVVISDPVGNVAPNAKAIPGATVRYTITITNSGAADATSVVMSDPIPANTNFVVGSVTDDSATGTVTFSNNNGGSYAYTPVGAPGAADAAVTNVRVSIPTVNASGGAIDAVVITFDVVIE